MLATQHLDIGYGKNIIQHDLNLTANSGDLICLTGTNGTGKSTLLRTLAGLQKPLGGEVLIQGQHITQLSNAKRATLLSLVLTDNIIVENLTLYDLVAMGRFPYTGWNGYLGQHDRDIVKTALEQVNLWHKAHYFINEVSDGEKQRGIIAKALAQDTPLILLDEPTAHLDLPNRVEIMLLLRRLSVNTRKTFILSTHELDLALQMADRIWLMGEHGIETGLPEDLMLTGKFQEAFGSTAYHFDETDGHCKIAPLLGNLTVTIRGNCTAALWLERALLRCGIRVTPDATLCIEAHDNHFVVAGHHTHTIEETLNVIFGR
ncbi:MAG: ABC transporter ATP-binding protein [Paludibacteraceae bacterium]